MIGGKDGGEGGGRMAKEEVQTSEELAGCGRESLLLVDELV